MKQIASRELGGFRQSELTLGTVQLGMPYGRANDTGQPTEADAIAIIRHAVACGVNIFDTAREYGTSEEILGRALRNVDVPVTVITKLGLSGLPESASPADVHHAVGRSISESCQNLKSRTLDVVLLHRWEHRHAWHGSAWAKLLELRRGGVVSALGASVYEPNDALAVLDDPDISFLQVPVNVLDWRWRQAGVEQAALARPDVSVHGRSALLQGILAHGVDRWPSIGSFDRNLCSRTLAHLAKKFDRDSVTDLCFAYVRSLPWLSSVVVGCDTLQQLNANVAHFLSESLTQEQRIELEHTLPHVPERFLDPSQWSSSHESLTLCAG